MHCSLITPRVQNWLRNGRFARVLHIFNEVVNLVNDRDDLISLAAPSVGAGPFTMLIAGDFSPYFDIGKPVFIDSQAETLICGRLVLDTRLAPVWQPCPDWQRVKDLSFASLPLANLPSIEIEIHLQQLLRGVARGDKVMCRAGASRLAGRGGGLTPAGDDVLMGVLYALWVWYPRREWIELIMETAVAQTTTLSAAFLRAAAAGEATYHWHNLVNSNSENGRVNAVAQILSIGHTSGADAWVGFVNTAAVIDR